MRFTQVFTAHTFTFVGLGVVSETYETAASEGALGVVTNCILSTVGSTFCTLINV